MSDEIRNGDDYLIDWYALLGIARDATAEMISSAYKAQQLKYHPDRYGHLAPEFQAQAGKRSALLSEGAAVLLDSEKRADYDARLAAWQGPLSADGTPILQLGRPRFLPLRLLEAGGEDACRRVREQILQLSGFDEKTFKLLERLMHAPDPDEETVEAYREALRRKSLHFELEESLLWETAGFADRQICGQTPRACLPQVEAELAAARETVSAQVASTLLALEGKPVKLLGTGGKIESMIVDEQAIVHYRAAALDQFDTAAAAIRIKATERQEMIGRRLELVAGEYRSPQPERFPRLIVIVGAGEKPHCFTFRLSGTSIVNDSEIAKDVIDRIDEPDTVRSLIAGGINVMHLTFEEDVDFREQLEAAVLRHFEALPDPQHE
jgi:curved DNA-binding protein CbpA